MWSQTRRHYNPSAHSKGKRIRSSKPTWAMWQDTILRIQQSTNKTSRNVLSEGMMYKVRLSQVWLWKTRTGV